MKFDASDDSSSGSARSREVREGDPDASVEKMNGRPDREARASSAMSTGTGLSSRDRMGRDRADSGDGSDAGSRDIPTAPQKLQADGWGRLSPSARTLTTVIRECGVHGLRVDQWYNVDVPEGVVGRVHALILLYKWRVDRGDAKSSRSRSIGAEKSESSGGGPGDILFINQFVNSASATQALVMTLLNVAEADQSRDIECNEGMQELLDYVRPLTSIVRAAAVCSSACVREAHNAAASAFASDASAAVSQEITLSDDFWLYTVYTPGKSRKWVYEMDGCGDEPSVLGHIGNLDVDDIETYNNEWVGIVVDQLELRVKQFREHRIPFELYAVVDDVPCGTSASEGNGDAEEVVSKGRRENGVKSGRSRTNGRRASGEELRSKRTAPKIEDTKTKLHSRRGSGEDKVLGKRRRPEAMDLERERLVATHNYDAFLVEMLKLLASKGYLSSLIENACKESEGEHPPLGGRSDVKYEDGDNEHRESNGGGSFAGLPRGSPSGASVSPPRGSENGGGSPLSGLVEEGSEDATSEY